MRLAAAPALTLALTLGLGLGLTACSPGTTPTASPSSIAESPSSSPSAEAPDPEVVVDRIVFRADSFDVLATDGSLIASSSILEDGPAILDTFEAAFGTEPQESSYEGGIETQPGTLYDWGGLAVRVGEKPYNYYEQDVTVEIAAAAVGDVELATEGGVSIGMPLAELTADELIRSEPDDFLVLVEAVTIATAEEAGFPGEGNADGDLRWSIAAGGDASGVTLLFLPARNYGV